MLPETLVLLMEHCEKPLKLKSTGVTWEGDDELAFGRFLCDVCGLTVVVETREHVGPPGGS